MLVFLGHGLYREKERRGRESHFGCSERLQFISSVRYPTGGEFTEKKMTWSGCVTLFVFGINAGFAFHEASISKAFFNLLLILMTLYIDCPREREEESKDSKKWYACPKKRKKKKTPAAFPMKNPNPAGDAITTPPCNSIAVCPNVCSADAEGEWFVKRSRRGYSDC